MRRSVRRTSRKPKRSKRSARKPTKAAPSKRKPTKKKSSKRGKKKMNAYMLALNKARKAGADSFEYNGKTYYKKVAKTGMVLYSGKKSGTKKAKRSKRK